MGKSRPSIPIAVKTNLWRASAGRCQFDGCNKQLWRHDATMQEMNKSYIAHIHAYSELGPRYHEVLSPKLEKDFSNLMLVCDECHRLFDDTSRAKKYTPERLRKMKRDHEDRIELVTGIISNKKTHLILYGARIGVHSSPLSYNQAAQTVLPDYYPNSDRAIEINLKTSFQDNREMYWQVEEENLINEFKEKVEHLKVNSSIQHYSIFGLAPQPLLIKLGTLLNDIYPARIYQLHREPATWKWLNEFSGDMKLYPEEPPGQSKVVALKLELSATINDERVIDVVGDECDIWSLKIEKPHNDFLVSETQLLSFRITMRQLFDQIKARHSEDAVLHVFPAMPVSTSIEMGRVWMPKADLPMIIYDQNTKKGGFLKALEIRN